MTLPDSALKARTLDILIQEHSRLRALLDNIPDLVFFKDQDGVYLDCNTAFTDLLGLSRYEVIGQKDEQVIPARSAVFREHDAQVTAQERPFRANDSWVNRQGQQVEVDMIRAPVFDETGHMLGIVGMGRDVTRQHHLEERLRLAASVFEHAYDGIMITDAHTRIIEVNEAFERLTGYRREEVIGKSPRILQSGRHDEAFYREMWASVKTQDFWKGEIWNRHKSGDIYPEDEVIIAVRNAAGDVTHYLSVFSDISEVKATEERLRHMAHHDALTHLPNRTLLADRIAMALAQTSRRKNLLAVCYLDLDGFKPVNDTYGHGVGDRLLVEIANRLQDCLRAGDTVARLGGDEFALLLTDLDSLNRTEILLHRVLSVIAQPFQIDEITHVSVSASIGYTLYPEDNHADADTLLRHADQAMYKAKLGGRNRIHQFDLYEDKRERSQLESAGRISQAVTQDELVVFFQPLVDMRQGVVVGAEALVRWQHPERGLLPPGDFLPLVENTDVITQIGYWVLEHAVGHLAQWHAEGLVLKVSVNIAARHLLDKDFVPRLGALLADYPDLPPQYLELEIVETAALEDMAHVSTLIDACRELGVRFALDDFGTGYSSLTYFKRLAADTLKIDQSFVRDILDDPEDRAIVEGILGLTSAFHRDVIAEGVETIEHGILLLKLGCDYAQGFGIARPMPAAALAEWARQFEPDPSWVSSTTLRWRLENFPLVAVEVVHRRWAKRIERVVQALDSATETEMLQWRDISDCRFAQWYEQAGKRQFSGMEEFEAIRPLHDYLHVMGGQIADALLKGDRESAQALLPELKRIELELTEALSTLQVVVAMGVTG